LGAIGFASAMLRRESIDWRRAATVRAAPRFRGYASANTATLYRFNMRSSHVISNLMADIETPASAKNIGKNRTRPIESRHAYGIP
jgi:hypothetical protein